MKKQIIAVIVGTVLMIGGFIWYVSDEGPDISNIVKEQIPDMTMSYSGNVLKEERDGKVIWELTADKIEVDSNSKNAVLKKVKGKFYSDDGVVTDLVAEKAMYDQKKNLITLNGAIHAEQSDGGTLKADEAKYDAQKRQLQCKGHVEVNKGGYLITGDRLIADDVKGKIRVDGNAQAVQIGG